jgi:succinylglutamate desuccinylase
MVDMISNEVNKMTSKRSGVVLQRYETVSAGLYAKLMQAEPNDLQQLLGGPSLLHFSGQRSPALFVSVLLHGNEDTGWYALRNLLEQYQGREFPRAISVFVGNVAAAEQGLRRLDGQLDYNRIWKRDQRADEAPEQQMAQQVLQEMQQRGVFASIDVHNNSGRNPHYGCVNVLQPEFLHLAALFSRTVVWFLQPDTVQSMAFSKIVPAVTIECGKPGQPFGVEHVRDYLNACLHLQALPTHPVAPHDLDLYHTVATVKVPEAIEFCFCGEDALEQANVDLVLAEELDRMNFIEYPAGTQLAECRSTIACLQVIDEDGKDCTEAYVRREDGILRTLRPVMPSMFTLDARIVRQDCLGYLMERVPVAHWQAAQQEA